MTEAGSGAKHTETIDREAEHTVGLLAIVAGVDAGREYLFGHGTCRIGTSEAAEIQLHDPGVSRLHAEVRRDEDGVRLVDLGSKNGCWLGGSRIRDATVSPGTRFRLGNTTLEATLARRRVTTTQWQGGNRLQSLIAESTAMHALFAQISKIAESRSAVLIRGETGTGKELVADALHALSGREGPLVVVDGAAITGSLADDELFGHMRGAFTGAHADHAGAFERADGGTLFIDEVGDLTPEVQKKLLRAIDTGTIRRVGGDRRIAVDVRIVAATHRSLEEMVNARTFREDLFHRLRVIELMVPPLRDRGHDVYLLARTFMDEITDGDAEAHREIERALAAREGHGWPGNVRELRNFVRRVAALGHIETVIAPGGAGITPTIRTDLPYGEAKEAWTELFARAYVAKALDESGSIAAAARRSGLSRVHMSNLVKQLGLRSRNK